MTSIASKLIERFDSKKVFKFSDVDPFSEESAWISTSSPSLDRFLKTHGIPTGIVEVRGDSQAGKTTFTLMVMKSCLEEYGDRAVINILSSERRDNKPYAERLGIYNVIIKSYRRYGTLSRNVFIAKKGIYSYEKWKRKMP